MNKLRHTPIALLTLAALTVGCNSGGGGGGGYKAKPVEKVAAITLTPGKEDELFPVKAGNQWVYEAEAFQTTPQGQQSNKSTVTFQVTEVVDTPEGKLATIEVSSDEKLSDRLKWRVGPTGVYQMSGSTRDKIDSPLKEAGFEPAVPALPFPVKEGSEVVVTANGIRPGAGIGPFKAKVTIEGIQEVDSAMGRFNAVCVSSDQTYKEKDFDFRTVSTSFWVPKVGIVRYIQEMVVTNPQGKTITTSSTMRLKSHSP